MRVASILSFAGIDTSGATGPTTLSRSPTGLNSHEPNLFLGSVFDTTTSNDHTSDFFLGQAFPVAFTMWQNPGINNSGKQFLAVFYLP